MRVTGMPISEQLQDYNEALDNCLATAVPTRGLGGIIQSYAFVRQMRYFSGPDRTPLTALRTGQGACTAKHIILRDLLRLVGARAEVEVVEGDFAGAIPLHASQSPGLQAMIRQRGVTDFHCRVRLIGPDTDQRLDATWPDALAAYGFATGRGWTGTGDTVQAMPDAIIRASPEDVLETKSRMVATLGPAATARRLEFLRLLSGWLAGLDKITTRGEA